jgi:large subunit ribosomal protein L18
MPRGMHFSRRNKGITNYRKRLALLKSGIPRAVVRFSNAKVTVQIIEFSIKGDTVLASASSNDVAEMGWKGSKTNVPASYLSGLLTAKKSIESWN